MISITEANAAVLAEVRREDLRRQLACVERELEASHTANDAECFTPAYIAALRERHAEISNSLTSTPHDAQ